MNKRDYKQCGPSKFYHIYNRGNSKQSIFLDDQDFEFFISRLRQNLFPDDKIKDRLSLLPADSFSLISYCLMPNHFHLLLFQKGNIPTSKLISRVCTSYSKYFNKKHNHVGHVFQDKFKQVNVSNNQHLLWLSCYIHQNPKVAGLVQKLEDYTWSSYPDFIEQRNDILCDKTVISKQFKNMEDYRRFVESSYEIIKNKKELEELMLD